ncbi:MAG: hypothetical protein WBV22_07950 [Anaerolineaceae bacterium]
MPEKKMASCLNEWFVRLSQSINIEYLAVVDANGEALVSAGNFGLINRPDAESVLHSYFKLPEHMYMPEDISDVHIIKQGAVECFVTPINGTVQLLAISSIERPSVLIRIMLKEILTAREEITEVVNKEWKAHPYKLTKPGEMANQMPRKTDTTDEEREKEMIPLEDLITSPGSGTKIKEASKFWDAATLEDEQRRDNEKTISFNEAKRSGLVPDDKQ